MKKMGLGGGSGGGSTGVGSMTDERVRDLERLGFVWDMKGKKMLEERRGKRGRDGRFVKKENVMSEVVSDMSSSDGVSANDANDVDGVGEKKLKVN